MDSSDSRMKSLEDQWRSHSAPLVQQIEDLKLKASTRQAEIELKLSELQDFKQEMKSSSEEAKTKDELLKSLVCFLLFPFFCHNLQYLTHVSADFSV